MYWFNVNDNVALERLPRHGEDKGLTTNPQKSPLVQEVYILVINHAFCVCVCVCDLSRNCLYCVFHSKACLQMQGIVQDCNSFLSIACSSMKPRLVMSLCMMSHHLVDGWPLEQTDLGCRP